MDNSGSTQIGAGPHFSGGVVILGVTSALARAIAMEYARQKYDLVVAARDQEENEIIATDLRVRFGVKVTALPFEAENFDGHRGFFDACRAALGDGMAGVVLCFGYLEEQSIAEKDFTVARRIIDVNYTSAVSILELFAGYFEERKLGGFIAGLSSVAGDRGRQSNYLYCSAKAGLSAYLQGLRNRLFKSNVAVVTIKPGFVDTKMTFGMDKLFLVASPADAGSVIHRAIVKRRDVVYVPWFWRYIMLIIIHVPEMVFKRMKL